MNGQSSGKQQISGLLYQAKCEAEILDKLLGYIKFEIETNGVPKDVDNSICSELLVSFGDSSLLLTKLKDLMRRLQRKGEK